MPASCSAKEIAMGVSAKKIWTLCGLAGLLALSNCATTHESLQDCRKAAYSFCDETAGAKAAGARGSGAVDAAARNSAYQQCLDTQLAACGAP
jgi:hypothetical protein